MRISVSFKEDVAIMGLTGKFVAGSDGPFLRQKVKDLIDAGAKKLVLDFTEVPYIDSTGLGFLAGSRVTAQNAGVSVVLAGVNQHVKRILDGVRLTPFLCSPRMRWRPSPSSMRARHRTPIPTHPKLRRRGRSSERQRLGLRIQDSELIIRNSIPRRSPRSRREWGRSRVQLRVSSPKP